LFLALVLDIRGPDSPAQLVLGFVAPVIFGYTDDVYVRALCGMSRGGDGAITVSIVLATFVYGAFAVSVTMAAANRFNDLSGRQESYNARREWADDLLDDEEFTTEEELATADEPATIDELVTLDDSAAEASA
jgi:hypothetical protein